MQAAALDEARATLLERREQIDRRLAERLAALPDDALPELFALAHRVRLAWMGPAVEVESIISAKTGGCPEDCVFCSQSARFHTDVVREPMLPTGQLVELARRTRALGGTEFCIVVAVRGPDERMMRAVVDATQPAAAVHRQVRAWSFMPQRLRVGPVFEGRRLVRTGLEEVAEAERLDCGDGPLWILEAVPA